MRWMWLWSGPCFGYREGDDVWTYDGAYVGMFAGTEIYAPSGRYLGEIRNRDRLIVDRAKQDKTIPPFEPKAAQVGHARYGDELGYPLSPGVGDFPPARSFRAWQDVKA
jgi:hypothetical protein